MIVLLQLLVVANNDGQFMTFTQHSRLAYKTYKHKYFNQVKMKVIICKKAAKELIVYYTLGVLDAVV